MELPHAYISLSWIRYILIMMYSSLISSEFTGWDNNILVTSFLYGIIILGTIASLNRNLALAPTYFW